MSSALWPFLLGRPYGEGFDHDTARDRMGGGRSVRAALMASVGLFRAEGSLRVPQGSDTYDTLAAFMVARRGSYDTFLYLPALTTNRRSTTEAVGTGDASTILFALDYKYPKTGTFTLTVDGVAKTEGTHWNLADSAGGSFSLGEAPYIKFTGGNTPGSGHAIVATYDFYVPVFLPEGDSLMRALSVLSHGATSAATKLSAQRVMMEQDLPGSHLVTVPAV